MNTITKTKNNFWPKSRVTKLLNIDHPIIQAGMVWVSGGKLAAAAANSGCLGLIGAGSMTPQVLEHHIQKAHSLTEKSIGVNIPLFSKYAEDHIKTALKAGIKIFFTSAGSPKKWTSYLKQQNCTVVQVTSNPELAKKSENYGVDAVVVEGFEAGGHNGRDELTTLVLLQQVKNQLSIPVIAAGGIGTGDAMLAAFALGAEGVQMGTIFAATKESSAHINFKRAMCEAQFNKTFLRMKNLMPVRLLDNSFSQKVADAENNCATKEELIKVLGKGRAEKGMHNGDVIEGELETGQIVSQINKVLSCQQLVKNILNEYQNTKKRIF